ncbi:leucine-rich repeat, cysteine-containing subtype protein [Tanacetum coccineum]
MKDIDIGDKGNGKVRRQGEEKVVEVDSSSRPRDPNEELNFVLMDDGTIAAAAAGSLGIAAIGRASASSSRMRERFKNAARKNATSKHASTKRKESRIGSIDLGSQGETTTSQEVCPIAAGFMYVIVASNLTVLQLDQCGRCLPDYVLLPILAFLPSQLSALTNISLKGACRLSDAGLKALVDSAPALRSINLGCCSLLTVDAINNLADKLGSVLKELYIDECFDLDAKHILPALLKLEQLQVLSVAHNESVDNSFIIKFVAAPDCTKLTDKALRAISKSCPGLCAVDPTNVCKLTEKSLAHLANGCPKFQILKFCRNTDEAVAAYLEACGAPLREPSLNHVNKVPS